MGVFDTDHRMLALGFARMADSIGNSFLIVVLPLFVGSEQVPPGALTGTYGVVGLAFAGDLANEDGSETTLSVLTMAFGLGVAIGPLRSGYLVGGTFGFATRSSSAPCWRGSRSRWCHAGRRERRRERGSQTRRLS